MGEAKEYTPGIGCSEVGDGNGTKGYELMGIPDGSGWVGTLEPLEDELRRLERGGDEATFPDEDELVRLEVRTEDK